jgi:hypothetical protein
VSLTYKRSGVFETSIGGVCSIFSFIILAYWLIVNIAFAIYDHGSFATASGTKLTQKSDGS